MKHLFDLPREIILLIIDHCDYSSYGNLLLTCHLLYSLGTKNNKRTQQRAKFLTTFEAGATSLCTGYPNGYRHGPEYHHTSDGVVVGIIPWINNCIEGWRGDYNIDMETLLLSRWSGSMKTTERKLLRVDNGQYNIVGLANASLLLWINCDSQWAIVRLDTQTTRCYSIPPVIYNIKHSLSSEELATIQSIMPLPLNSQYSPDLGILVTNWTLSRYINIHDEVIVTHEIEGTNYVDVNRLGADITFASQGDEYLNIYNSYSGFVIYYDECPKGFTPNFREIVGRDNDGNRQGPSVILDSQNKVMYRTVWTNSRRNGYEYIYNSEGYIIRANTWRMERIM